MPGWPTTFANLTGTEPLSLFDTMFNQVAAGMEIPCSAAGTNLIALTPLTNFPALSSYNELGGYRFRAAGTSTGAVTLQYNGLAVLPLYKADGATQANVGDLQIGQEYVARFSQSLNGGAGGFFLEAPAVSAVVPGTQTPPGGRLSLVNNQPVMFSNQSAIQNIFYPPYVHPFVPLYNGSTVQMYQFTSALNSTTGLTLALGGAANFPVGTNFDVYCYLNAGSPALCAIAWTNPTTRATTLSVFGGFLTNAGSATAQTGPNTNFTLPINQGTFLGTFNTLTQGACNHIFGASASGGSAAIFGLCNYYNKIKHTTIVGDSGTAYTYTTGTARQARASSGNQINFVQSDSERAIIAAYHAYVTFAGVSGAFALTGIGLNSTTAFSTQAQFNNASAQANACTHFSEYMFSFTGSGFITALEQGDGSNANSFDTSSVNQLQAQIWL